MLMVTLGQGGFLVSLISICVLFSEFLCEKEGYSETLRSHGGSNGYQQHSGKAGKLQNDVITGGSVIKKEGAYIQTRKEREAS